MQLEVPTGGTRGGATGLTEGVTIGQTLGAQTGGTAIDDEQRAFTSPFTQAQRQELVCCAAARPAVKTTKKNTQRLIFVFVLSLLQFCSYRHLPTGDCELPFPGLVTVLRDRDRVNSSGNGEF